MVNSPLVDGIEVPARVLRAQVWPVVTLLETAFRKVSESEDTDICRAHQVGSDGLEAVVYTYPQHEGRLWGHGHVYLPIWALRPSSSSRSISLYILT